MLADGDGKLYWYFRELDIVAAGLAEKRMSLIFESKSIVDCWSLAVEYQI